jgi:hypothetical protein
VDICGSGDVARVAMDSLLPTLLVSYSVGLITAHVVNSAPNFQSPNILQSNRNQSGSHTEISSQSAAIADQIRSNQEACLLSSPTADVPK